MLYWTDSVLYCGVFEIHSPNRTMLGVSNEHSAENRMPSMKTYFPPYRCDKIPPGICVNKYPKKNEDNMIPCCSCDQLNTSLSGWQSYQTPFVCVHLWRKQNGKTLFNLILCRFESGCREFVIEQSIDLTREKKRKKNISRRTMNKHHAENVCNKKN